MTPNHLELKSADGTKLNLEALYQIAPSCFTEVKDEKTGELRHVVNFTTLRQLLGDDAVDDAPEMYQFTWPGKQEARREAARPITDTLRPCPEESVDWDTTQNLYIEGDNLSVLKLLQKGYMGKVKMIYIDPPYNTGKEFIYNDDYQASSSEFDLFSGDVDQLGNRYRKNTDTNARFHSDWCSMMYARLLTCRSLLSEDGVIFISIDDNELRNLKIICDDIFGEKNFVGQWHWFKSATPPNLSYKIKKNIEYVLAYEKVRDNVKFAGVQKVSSSNDPFTKPQNSIKTLTFGPGTIHTPLSDGVYPAGTYGTAKFPNILRNDLIVKNGFNVNEVSFDNRFIWVQSTLEENLKAGTKVELSKNLVLSYKKADYDPECPPNLIDSSVGVDTTEEAGKALDKLMGDFVFQYPKPVSLMKYLLSFKLDSEAIVLDFFSGSASTAHSIFEINAEKHTNVKFILVQIPEKIEPEKCTDDGSRKAAENATKLCDSINVSHTLCEIGKERIRRAGALVKGNSGIMAQDLDTGFRVFKLSDSNFNEVYFSPKEFTQDLLSGLESNIKKDRTDLDLLFGAMLDWGVQLSLPMSKETVDGCDIYTVNEGDLVACFSENVTENVVSAMASKMPLRVLFRDSCFSEDKAKINVFELFKQKLDWGEDEAIKNIRVI